MRGAYDFETWEWANPLCCGFAWGPPGQRQHFFLKDPAPHTSPIEVAKAALQYMHARDDIKEWWAHNGGKYDTLFLIQAALAMRWKFQGHTAGGGRLIYFTARPPGAKRGIHCYDSYAVISTALGKAAKELELPSAKLFTKDDYSVDPRKWDPTRLRVGCLTDCELVLELLERAETLFETWGGSMKSTFSASALAIVKSSLDMRGLKLPCHKGNQDSNKFARQGYYGSRVEVLHHMPGSWLTEYDVCSSYPWSMTQTVPFDLIGRAEYSGDVKRVLKGKENIEGMVRARVHVPHRMRIPPLPWTSKERGIYFPTGIWEAVFPACELRYAMELGVEVEPFEAIAYDAQAPFHEFVANVYQTKRTAIGVMRVFAKYVLNGCYGKFAQSPEADELLCTETEEEADSLICAMPPDTVGRLSRHDKRILTVKRMRWPKHTHFALASYVTAYSRMKLHSAMLQCPDVAYVDTDSLHVPEGSKPPKPTGTDLGDWKVEIPRYKGTFYAPKLYKLIEPDGTKHLAMKGFPVDPDAFERVVALEAIEVERMQLVKSQLRNGGVVKRLSGELADVRRWRGHSSKRCPLPDGTTRPWRVDELLRGEQADALSPPVAHLVGKSKRAG